MYFSARTAPEARPALCQAVSVIIWLSVISRDRKKKQKTGRVGSGLVTLGAAAVMTIYSTGYLRTKSAAQRLEAAERPRVVVPAPLPAVATVPAPVLTPQAIPPAKPK